MALDWVAPDLACCYLLLFFCRIQVCPGLGRLGSCGFEFINPDYAEADLSTASSGISKNTWSNLSISVLDSIHWLADFTIGNRDSH